MENLDSSRFFNPDHREFMKPAQDSIRNASLDVVEV